MPQVSIVVPTRNRSALLRRTLRCALDQRGVDIEVVVVDDGSRDDTVLMVGGFSDPRLHVVRHESSLGVSASRNRGISEARGDWVAFLDDDDLWAPSKIQLQLAAAIEAGRDWAYTGAVAVDGALRVLAGAAPPSPAEVAAALPYRNAVPAGSSNVMARATLLELVGSFDEGLRHMADWDMWIRLRSSGLPAAVPRPVVAYLLHPGNASLDVADIPHEMLEIEKRYAESRTQGTVDRAYVYRWMAWSALRAKNRTAAARAYLRAAASGDPKSVARAAVALVHPSVVNGRYGRDTPDLTWAAEADAWLEPIRST